METFFGIDLAALIKAIGYIGVFSIIFAESGLLLGFFLPGDSLLFTVGFLASQNYLNIWILTVGCFIAAVLGDNVGYAFGRRIGPRIFRREKSFFFNPENVAAARRFYATHGGKTIILARFLPGVRTFAPILAGVGGMQYHKFFFYNVAGAAVWAIGLSLTGYFLGQAISNVDRYLLPIIAAIIVASAAPAVIHILENKEKRRRIAALFRKRV